MNKKKVIGYVSMDDPFHNKVAWSGSIYKLREAIEMAGYEVRWIPYNVSMKNKMLYYYLMIQKRFFHKKKWITKYNIHRSRKSR